MGQPFGRTPIRTMGPRKSGAIGQQKSQQPNAGIIDMFARLLHVSSAGRKACCELVRAAATADLARTGTLTPAQRAAAGRALAQLREIVDAGSLCLFDIIGSAKELRDTVAALAEVLSVSLREVASLAALPAYCECSQAEGDSSCGGTGLRQASTQGSRAFDSAAAVARPSDGGPSDWVPLVDCARVVSYCLFYGMGSSSTSGGIGELLRGVSTAAPTTTTDARVRDKRSNTLALVAALLHSDALPALSRLLSAEAQRGASLALLSPKGLTDCVQLLDTLMHATTEAPAALLPVALPASDTTRAHSHSYVPNPHEQQQQRQQQQRSSAAASPAPPTAASTAPQRLGPAVWTAMAQCAVVEAACRLVAMRLGAGGQQGGAGRWAEADEGSDLLRPLLSAVFEVADANEKARGMAAGGEQLPVSELLLRDVLAAPCAQVPYGYCMTCNTRITINVLGTEGSTSVIAVGLLLADMVTVRASHGRFMDELSHLDLARCKAVVLPARQCEPAIVSYVHDCANFLNSKYGITCQHAVACLHADSPTDPNYRHSHPLLHYRHSQPLLPKRQRCQPTVPPGRPRCVPASRR